MNVSNPLELYTVYIGWQQYDVMWQTAIDTGLAYIPFLGLFFENLTKPFESAFANGVDTSFRRVFIEFFVMCLVIMFCVCPALSLATKDITYKPFCSQGATTSTVGDSGTTYDNTFGSLITSEVKVPLFYALVLDFASGFTNALITGLPCDTNLRQTISTIDSAEIPPALKMQEQAFNQECYLPAKASFESQHPDPNSYKQTMKRAGGEADLNWMGSKTLSQLYYANLTPTAPVAGFPYRDFPNANIDDAVTKGQMEEPKWGYPTCQEWWSDSSYGLEHNLAKSAEATVSQNDHAGTLPLSDQVDAYLAKHKMNFGSDLTEEDVIAHGVLYDNPNNTSGFGSSASASVDTNSGGIATLYKPLVQAGQVLHNGWGNGFQRDALSDVLPIFQAFLMFLTILFACLIQIFGRYRAGVVLALSFMFFGLIFLDYIWAVLGYLENALINSTTTPLNLSAFGEHATLENLMTALYFGAPMFFLSLMGITGVKIGSAVNEMMRSGSDQGTGIAKEGESMTKGAIKIVGTLAE